MVNNTSKIERMVYISILNPFTPIEKPFYKTHPPVFGRRVPEKFKLFSSSRIHTNPTQPPPKTGLGNLYKELDLHRIRGDLDCIHWCKRKTLHLGGLYFLS